MKNKYLLITFIAVLFLEGCSSSVRGLDNSSHRLPKQFNFKVEIHNGSIIKVNTQSVPDILGRIKWTEKYIEFSSVYLNITSSKFPNKIWQVQLPKNNGKYKLTAVLYNEDLTLKELSVPPNSLIITVTIKNKRIIKHSIKKIHPLFGRFQFVEKDISNNILFFKNNKYLGETWVVKYLDNMLDGDYDLNMILMN